MKYGKDEIQKMFLGALLLVGFLWYYFTMLLGPLNTAEAAAMSNKNEKGPMVEKDKAVIRTEMDLKPKAEAAEATLEQAKKLIPDGSPVAWFPPLAIEFFKRQGVEKCAVHRVGEGFDRELTGFKDLTWGLDISHIEVSQLAAAIAAFENEHPLMDINNLQIESGKDNVQYQTARLSVNTVIKQ